MKTTFVVLALLASIGSASAQKIITVGPNGSSTVETPRTSATVVVRSGRTTAIIGPNGTTAIVRSGGTTAIIGR
jgi:hypothetical protein